MIESIEISRKTLFFTIFFCLALWLLYLIRNIVFIIFIAFIIVSALNPTVEKMEKNKIPRTTGILLLFLAIFIVLGFMSFVVFPPLVNQSLALVNEIPKYIARLRVFGDGNQIISFALGKFSSLPKNLIKLSLGVFNNFISVVGLVVIIFYMLKERKHLEKYLTSVFGDKNGNKIFNIVSSTEKKLGGWVRGELILMFFVGLLSFLGFMILGLEFALPLAVIAFFLELLPTLGPIIAAIPAIAFALTVSPLLALLTAVSCFLVQQVENSILVPRIMKASVGVNPLISILSLSMGYAVGGVGGAVLSLPVFLTLQVVFKNIFSSETDRR